MKAFFALLQLDLKVLLRNWQGLLAQFGLAVLVGMGPLITNAVESVKADIAPPEAGATCPEPEIPMAAEGTWPEWMGTPDASASVALIWTEDSPIVLQLKGGTPEDRKLARACVEDRITAERDLRMATFGVRWPEKVAEVTPTSPLGSKDAAEFPEMRSYALMSTMVGLILTCGLFLEVLPRRRENGLYETLRATGVPMGTLVGSLFALGLPVTLLALLVTGTTWTVVHPDHPVQDVLIASWHAFWTVGFVSALTLRTTQSASSMQGAMVRWLGVFLGIMGWMAFTVYLWKAWGPGVAACMPGSGAVLGGMGWLGSWTLLGDLSAVLGTLGMLTWSAVSLENEVHAGPGVDASLLRQARGNYLPEVAVLSLCGACSVMLSGAGTMLGSMALTLTVVFTLLMLVPSVCTPWAVGLPFSEVLPFSKHRAWPTVPLYIVAFLCTGPAVAAFSFWMLPANSWSVTLAEQMSETLLKPEMILVAGIAPGICEEILFRGAILSLLKRGRSFWVANVIQAALFSVMHVLAPRLIWTFFFGLVLGWIVHRTKSLAPSMVIHTLHNLLIVGVATLLPAWSVGPWAVFAGLPLLAAAVWFTLRRT